MFVERLAALTGADVAASDDATGAQSRGGDWVLEYASAPIESPMAFTTQTMIAYPGVLADIAVDQTADFVDFTGGQQFGDLPGPDGLISLREAVIAANNTPGPDTITVPTGNYTLSIAGTIEDLAATDDLDITDAGMTTIRGAGATLTTIDANGLDRVLDVLPGASLLLENTKVTGGSTGTSGGGIYNRGTAILTQSTVSANTASSSGGGIVNANYGIATLTLSTVSANSAGGMGGGIDNRSGTATLTRSTVSDNTADSSGGGIRTASVGTTNLINSTVSGNLAKDDGGGIYTEGAATLTQSTVSGNYAYNDGGGLHLRSGTATITHSTVARNMANPNRGGGLYIESGIATLTASLIAYHDGIGTGSNCAIGGGTLVDGGDNLADDMTCDLILGTLTGLDVSLGFNGGPTKTHALSVSSNAIDAATNCPDMLVFDQRGVPRPIDDNCDIGAVEYADPALTFVTTTADTVDGNISSISTLRTSPGPDGDISLREAVIATNNTAGADTIILDEGTYTLTIEGGGEDVAATGDLDILSDITIRGAGEGATIIDAKGLGDRVLHVHSGANLTLEQATITGGSATGFGGGIENYGAVTLTNSTVSGNAAIRQQRAAMKSVISARSTPTTTTCSATQAVHAAVASPPAPATSSPRARSQWCSTRCSPTTAGQP
jgi:predicted outer membrane repeat protein